MLLGTLLYLGALLLLLSVEATEHLQKWLQIFLVVGLFTAPAFAPAFAENPKLTVSQTLSLLAGLRNLDGHQVEVKNNGQDVVIMQPWDFGLGSLRLRISRDITIASAVEKVATDARRAIIKEVLKDKADDVTDIPPNTPAMVEYNKQMEEILNAPAEGTEGLVHIKASELKLDKNEIPVTALSALAPILDMDVN